MGQPASLTTGRKLDHIKRKLGLSLIIPCWFNLLESDSSSVILDIFKSSIILEKSFLITVIIISYRQSSLRYDYIKTLLQRTFEFYQEDGFYSFRAQVSD